MSERISIEAQALEIGWLIDPSGHGTWFSRGGQRIYAAWSDNGYATYGTASDADGRVVGRCEFYTRTGEPVSNWVRARLRGEPLPEEEGVAVQPAPRLRERLLAEVARLEAMAVGTLIAPWGMADRLRKIAEGTDVA